MIVIDRVLGIDAWLDTNHVIGDFSIYSETTHLMNLEIMGGGFDTGHLEYASGWDGDIWIGDSWGWPLSLYYGIENLNYVYFWAQEFTHFLDDWVKIVIRLSWQNWNIFDEWVYHLNDYHYNRIMFPFIGPPISIVDDDITSPNLAAGYAWRYSEHNTLFIYDEIWETTDENLLQDYWYVSVQDYESGISSLQIIIDGEEYFSFSGFKYPGFVDEEVFSIEIPKTIGEHMIRVGAINADFDRQGDSQSIIKQQILNVVDDDDIPPTIEIISAPTTVFDNESFYFINFTVSDSSGFEDLKVKLGQSFDLTPRISLISEENGIFTYSVGFFVHELKFGLNSFKITVWDADNDRLDDQLQCTKIVEITLEDDDDTGPVITYINYNPIILDSEDDTKIKIKTIDESGIKNVEILFNDQYYEGILFSDGYYYITIPNPELFGFHLAKLYAYDNDDDRFYDSAYTMKHLTFEVKDDDIFGPNITYIYTGDYTDGKPGTIIFTATDPSGIAGEYTATQLSAKGARNILFYIYRNRP